SAIPALIVLEGNVTASWCARDALRRRVSKSATGSVIVIVVFSCSPPGFSTRYAGADLDSGGLLGDEGEAEFAEERAAFIVGLGGGDDGDVETTDAVDLVLVDLVEH
ncbi:MAG: hypothetical protein RLZZ587_1148, partial [Actinomycetota bacterium]